jgi:hypothetical protein
MYMYPSPNDIVLKNGISNVSSSIHLAEWNYGTVISLQKVAKEFSYRYNKLQQRQKQPITSTTKNVGTDECYCCRQLFEWIEHQFDTIFDYLVQEHHDVDSSAPPPRFFVLKRGVWYIHDVKYVSIHFRQEMIEIFELVIRHQLSSLSSSSSELHNQQVCTNIVSNEQYVERDIRRLVCTEIMPVEVVANPSTPFDNNNIFISQQQHPITQQQFTSTDSGRRNELSSPFHCETKYQHSGMEQTSTVSVQPISADVRDIGRPESKLAPRVSKTDDQLKTKARTNQRSRYTKVSDVWNMSIANEDCTNSINTKKRKRKESIEPPIILSVEDLTYDWSDLKLGVRTGSAAWNKLLMKQHMIRKLSGQSVQEVPHVSAIDTLRAMQDLEQSIDTILPPPDSPLHAVINCSSDAINDPAFMNSIPIDLRPIFPRLATEYRKFIAEDGSKNNSDFMLQHRRDLQYMTVTEIKGYLRSLEERVVELDANEKQILNLHKMEPSSIEGSADSITRKMAPTHGVDPLLLAPNHRISPIVSPPAATIVNNESSPSTLLSDTKYPAKRSGGDYDMEDSACCWHSDFAALLKKGGPSVEFLTIHDQY